MGMGHLGHLGEGGKDSAARRMLTWLRSLGRKVWQFMRATSEGGGDGVAASGTQHHLPEP
jgi:hypothetical protein